MSFHGVKFSVNLTRMNKEQVIQTRDDIINAALPNVVFDGWRWDMVENAAIQAGFDPNIASAVFPDKMLDVLSAFSDMADRGMLELLAGQNPEDMRVRDRIRAGVMARFTYLQPQREAVRETLGFWAVPTRKPRAAKIVWRSADHIWNWAGDDAKDYNRYTKRGLLSGILVSTMLVWIDDDSPDLRVTQEFLDRRIDNVLFVGQTLGRFMKGFKKAS